MAHYQVILAYDGTHFAGYQRQARSRTVQGVVEAALEQLGWHGKGILSAGRTDTGVHASGQVIAFDLDWAHPEKELVQALNANLPVDVAARSVSLADPEFHPRYGAKARRYRYHLFCDEVRDPLREQYAWRVWPAVDPDRLQAAAAALTGSHDFAAFGSPLRPGGSTVRKVFSADWQAVDGKLMFDVVANAFLYHMVRRLVFLQVQAGQGRLTLEDLKGGISSQVPQKPGLAPPQGLVLAEVYYFDFAPECLSK